MCYDSFESEELNSKTKFFAKQTNKTTAQYLQKIIMFLQTEILPIVLLNHTETINSDKSLFFLMFRYD